MIGREINLLARYPKIKRNLEERNERKTEESRAIARKFGYDYFDGERSYGYGGFNYHPRFWTDVINDLISTYQLTSSSSVLDVGCAKGFFLYDLSKILPGIKYAGVDISEYALENAPSEVRDNLFLGSAVSLEFPDNSFDLVISINTIHNLNQHDCKKALAEIQRVSKKYAFITVDAYRDSIEKERMEAWNLTALTMMSVEEWKEFFKESGYKGDFYWFIP